MTVQHGNDDDRQVIPRWRTFRATIQTSELASLRASVSENIEAELATLRVSFDSDPGVYTAADLFSSLIADGRRDSETRRLAEFISGSSNVPKPLASFLTRVCRLEPESFESGPEHVFDSEQSRHDAVRRVRRLRSLLDTEPRNAVRWVDIALAHATLGNVGKATRDMRTALSLAPESRFVLRSATRFYIHIEDPEQANFILQRSERLRSDPWLLAAELSTSQLAFGKFNNERAARELLISDNLSPHSLSELASALATNEIRSGRDSRAKKLFAIALTAPTENAVAQAASVAEHGDIQIAPELLTIERGFEARAINNSRSGAWDLAAKEGQDWQFDQPFALEPALFTSYAAAIGTANFQLAYDVAVNGLRTHPYDAMLHNNAAFALGNLDRPAEAREHLTFAHDTDDDEDSYVHRATLGLILFREGNPTGGREKYLSAIEALIATKKEMAAVATVLWAIEESLVQSDVAKESKGLAGEAVRRFPSPEGTAVLARLNRLDGVDLRAFPVSVK